MLSSSATQHGYLCGLFEKRHKGKSKNNRDSPLCPQFFEQESISIRQALGKNCVATHYFGSTAMPGLHSKPVIDILAEVKNLSLMDISALAGVTEKQNEKGQEKLLLPMFGRSNFSGND